VFQHKPYLDNQIKTRGYDIVPVGFTAVLLIGLYSHKVHSVADLPEGAVIGVPNDPSNEGRALRMLDHEGAIKLKPDAGVPATTQDITSNPPPSVHLLTGNPNDSRADWRFRPSWIAHPHRVDWSGSSGHGDREEPTPDRVRSRRYGGERRCLGRCRSNGAHQGA
jgi:hypothetical protein